MHHFLIRFLIRLQKRRKDHLQRLHIPPDIFPPLFPDMIEQEQIVFCRRRKNFTDVVHLPRRCSSNHYFFIHTVKKCFHFRLVSPHIHENNIIIKHDPVQAVLIAIRMNGDTVNTAVCQILRSGCLYNDDPMSCRLQGLCESNTMQRHSYSRFDSRNRYQAGFLPPLQVLILLRNCLCMPFFLVFYYLRCSIRSCFSLVPLFFGRLLCCAGLLQYPAYCSAYQLFQFLFCHLLLLSDFDF